ncbi:hypothetical protein [Streptomyces sp. NPDC093591]|uniref:hypothetical protein n=1 Tax=Streptomyces sp. NPDC093591 TaxID=3366044 RepID=UPI00382967B5
MSMSPSNNDTSQESGSTRGTASKARRTTAKATAPASKAAEKAAGKTGDAASAAADTAGRSAGRAAEVTTKVAHTAAERVESGRQAVVAASGQAVALAKTAWTVIADRKVLVAGLGAGLTALGATSYAAGRRAGRRTLGPITRLTGGRI